MHLCEIATELLLRHFVNAAHDMFISLSESFSYSLEVPWVTWCTNCEPSLILPLITLLTCCYTCLCTQLLCCHLNQLSDCGGYPTCKPRTNMPYMKATDEPKATPTGCHYHPLWSKRTSKVSNSSPRIASPAIMPMASATLSGSS